MLFTSMKFFPPDSGLHPERLHPTRGVAASAFRPLRKIPHCCLPEESGPYLSPNVTGRPLKPATRRSLGRPLPHQLADTPRPPLWARACKHRLPFICKSCNKQTICGISPGFPRLSPSQRQVGHVLLTRPPLGYSGASTTIPRSTCMC